MTPEQLDVLLAIANRGAYLAPSDPSAGFEARAAANADLAAMRHPITAEALKEDGWVEIYEGCDWYRRVRPDPEFIDVYVGQDPDGGTKAGIDIHDTGIPEWFDGLRTMYDLRELVRLLGGENA